MMNVYESVSANKRKSWIVIIGFTLFIVIVSYVMVVGFGMNTSFVGWLLVFAGIMNFASYWYSDQIILGISGAHEAKREQYFDFYTAAQNLSMVARIPMPKLYVIDDTAMNAFATGRDPDHAAVCCTTGLLKRLNRTEVEGVIAHELSHVQNYDIRLMSIVTILVGFVTLLADWMIRASFFRHVGRDRNNQLGSIMGLVAIGLALLSPIIATLIKLAISRQREFLADANAVKLTRQPSGLMSALQKISGDQEPLEAANKATAHLYIANPLKNRKDGVGWFAGLFGTHPPVEERIKALQSMS